jgi:hypothetical protein
MSAGHEHVFGSQISRYFRVQKRLSSVPAARTWGVRVILMNKTFQSFLTTSIVHLICSDHAHVFGRIQAHVLGRSIVWFGSHNFPSFPRTGAVDRYSRGGLRCSVFLFMCHVLLFWIQSRKKIVVALFGNLGYLFWMFSTFACFSWSVTFCNDGCWSPFRKSGCDFNKWCVVSAFFIGRQVFWCVLPHDVYGMSNVKAWMLATAC